MVENSARCSDKNVKIVVRYHMDRLIKVDEKCRWVSVIHVSVRYIKNLEAKIETRMLCKSSPSKKFELVNNELHV